MLSVVWAYIGVVWMCMWVIVCVWGWGRGSFPDGLVVKNLPTGDSGSIPRLGRSPGGGHGNPLRYSCLENPTGRGAWWATVHRFAELDMSEVTEHAGVCVTMCIVVCECMRQLGWQWQLAQSHVKDGQELSKATDTGEWSSCCISYPNSDDRTVLSFLRGWRNKVGSVRA